MKAVRVHSYDEPPCIDEIPQPRVTAPWDVLVRVGAAGLCRTDLHVIEGQWQAIQNPDLPYVLGHENAGWVEAVGSAVTHVQVGDPVILHPLVTCGLCRSCRRGEDAHCANATFPGLNVDGGMADYLLTNGRAVLRLDDSLEPRQVAALADAGLTAYHAVKKAVPLLPPDAGVVVIGAGGLGHIGVQLLSAMTAAEVTVVDTSPAALELATTGGATNTVLSSPAANLEDELHELTHGGAAVVLDFVGEHGTEVLGPRALRAGGHYFAIGYGGEVRLPTLELISREVNVVGNLVGSYQELDELMTLTARGHVTLHTQEYRLEDVHRAMDDLDQGRLSGRGILIP